MKELTQDKVNEMTDEELDAELDTMKASFSRIGDEIDRLIANQEKREKEQAERDARRAERKQRYEILMSL